MTGEAGPFGGYDRRGRKDEGKGSRRRQQFAARPGPSKGGYDYDKRPNWGIGPLLMTLIVFFLVAALFFIVFVTFVGWIKIVQFGPETSESYLRNLWFDVTHLNHPEAMKRVKDFLRIVFNI